MSISPTYAEYLDGHLCHPTQIDEEMPIFLKGIIGFSLLDRRTQRI
ncbi:hypothetical protein V7121_18000 [Neobacillus drentensis]